MKHVLTRPIRTLFAGEIVAEVLIPERQTGKIAILAGGLPSSPVKTERLEFLAQHGYTAMFFRYRGSWESRGNFLEKSPAADIHDIITELQKKKSITDIASGKKIPLQVSAVHLFGGSFGGPAVLLNSKHPLVKKVIALSPVLDWQDVDKGDEPFNEHVYFLEHGYPGAYRVKSKNDWKKLLQSDFYNPATLFHKVDGKKVFILHALDDTTVPYSPVIPFAEVSGSSYYLKPHGGHHLHMTHKFLWKKIDKFLHSH